MIPRAIITDWRNVAPWESDLQVEQDLLIERILIEIFSEDFLSENLVFRGGTAIHKLYFRPQCRYSEDIDLVQTGALPVGQFIDLIRTKLKFLGNPKRIQKERNTTLIYHYITELPPEIKARLKIEINCREHFAVFGYKYIHHSINTEWFSGESRIKSYSLEELLGTKLRALYQRSKVRDLFDLFWALNNEKIDINKVIESFRIYISFSTSNPPTITQFRENLEKKIQDPEFRGDTDGLLRPEISYSIDEAYEQIVNKLINKIDYMT